MDEREKARLVTDRTCIRKQADTTLLTSLRAESIANDQLVALAAYMAAAGNETRLRMLYVLWKAHELCVCDLADIFEITQPAVSRHLKILRQKALVTARRDAQTIFYRICSDNSFARMLINFFSNSEAEKVRLTFLEDSNG